MLYSRERFGPICSPDGSPLELFVNAGRQRARHTLQAEKDVRKQNGS